MKINKNILFAAVLVAVAIGGVVAVNSYLGRAGASPQTGDYQVVKKMDLVQTVVATGQVKPASDVSLSFERGGKIVSANVKISQTVYQGQVLASLDTSDLAIQLESAQNALTSAQIKLEQTKDASDPARGGAKEIQTAIDNGFENEANKIKEAYISTDGIMGTSIDQFFNEPKSNAPIFGITITQGSSIYIISAPVDTLFKLNKEKRQITESMAKWQADLGNIDQENIDGAQNDAQDSLKKIQILLTDLAATINSYNSVNASDNLVYNSYKTAIQNARAGVDSTLAGLLAAKQTYNSSKAVANPDNLKMQEIAVSNAQNQVESIQNQITKSSIYSPISGIVSAMDAKIGQTAAAGIPLISVFSNSNLQIDVYLPESDIAKIKVGQSATASLDSFAGKTFGAHVVVIDPAARQNGAAQSYKTTLQFNANDGNVKPGMTTNVTIETDKKSGVIAIPGRAIIQKDGKDYVMVQTGIAASVEREISAGITGQDGYIEVVSGLNEGDTIINY